MKPMSQDNKNFVHPKAFLIYTDGSFRPPDAAACSFVIFSNKTKHVVSMKRFAYRGQTNNQMELRAIFHALDHPNMDYVHIFSDSMYCIMALSTWYKTWEKRGWKNPLGEDIAHKELIQEILVKIKAKKFVKFIHVKAHQGDPFNSIADYLAAGLTARMVHDLSIQTQEVSV